MRRNRAGKGEQKEGRSEPKRTGEDHDEMVIALSGKTPSATLSFQIHCNSGQLQKICHSANIHSVLPINNFFWHFGTVY